MSCEEILVLLMGYIDDELDGAQRARVEEHLKTCPACTRELESYRRLGRTLDEMSFVEPGDVVWENFHKRLYNRTERTVGWVLAAIGVIILVAYALYELFRAPDVTSFVKVGVAALAVGLMLLMISFIRLRLRLWRVDKYKEVKR